MTWAAARDPGFASVRFWLARFNWRVANVRGCWRLYDGNRIIATAPNTHAMVRRIRALSVAAEAMRRIEAERVASCTKVATSNHNPQDLPAAPDMALKLRTGT